MATKDQAPEIDAKAAPCTGQDDAIEHTLEHAMKNLRKPRKSRQAAPAAKAKPKAKIPKTKGVKKVTSESNEVPGEFDLKTQITEKELKFIQLYLSGEYTTEIAMNLSGYENLHPRYKYFLASKIIQKYESSAGEHRKTFRAVGAGEVSVAQGLLKLATTAKSEMVRLNAWIAIGKILGLTQDVVAINQGIQIVIKGRGEGPAGGGRPAHVNQDQPRALPATLSITK